MMEYALLATVACSKCGHAMYVHKFVGTLPSDLVISCDNDRCDEHQIKYQMARVPLERAKPSSYMEDSAQ